MTSTELCTCSINVSCIKVKCLKKIEKGQHFWPIFREMILARHPLLWYLILASKIRGKEAKVITFNARKCEKSLQKSLATHPHTFLN